MKLKFIGWAAVYACIVAVAVAVNGGRETQPQSAQASIARPNPWPAQTSIACQAVATQMGSIRNTLWIQEQNNQLSALDAMDQLVSRESMIDTTQCPADFRSAEARMVIAQNTLSVDAHIDYPQNGDATMRELFARPANSTGNSAAASEGFKRDLQAMQSAAADFDQTTAKYCAK